MQPPSHRSTSSEWVSIGRASQLLGVNPGTLRQWTSLGKLHAYRTPGGHRRFSAAELASLAETSAVEEAAPSLAETLVQQLKQRYHSVAQSAVAHEAWLAELDPSARQRFHELGDALLGRLRDYVLGTGPRQRRLAFHDARAIGYDYGQMCRAVGLDTARAVEAYVVFRRPVLDVLAKALTVHPEQGAQISRVMRDAERFMDEVLSSIAGATSDRPASDRQAS